MKLARKLQAIKQDNLVITKDAKLMQNYFE